MPEYRPVIITLYHNKTNVRPRLEARTGKKANNVLGNSSADRSLNGKIISPSCTLHRRRDEQQVCLCRQALNVKIGIAPLLDVPEPHDQMAGRVSLAASPHTRPTAAVSFAVACRKRREV
jgi:hypothetical protein